MSEKELEEKIILRILSRRLLEEKQATSSPSIGDGEYLRSLSDSAGRIGEEEREGWGERRSTSLGEKTLSLGEAKCKVEDQASPTPSLDQECLGEPFSSLSSLSNFLKRKERERSREGEKEEKEKEERSNQLSIDGPRDSGEGPRQLGPSQQQVMPIQISPADNLHLVRTKIATDDIWQFWGKLWMKYFAADEHFHVGKMNN